MPWAAYLVLVVVWVASLASLGAYATRFAGAGTEMYRAVVRAAVSLVALAACVAFFFHVPFSRLVIAVAVPVMLVLSIVSRRMLRQSIAKHRMAGAWLQATLLVGDAGAVREMAHHIGSHPSESGMRVVGACVTDLDDPAVSDLHADGIAVLGGQHDTLEVVERCGVEAVAVASNPDMHGQTLRRLGWSLEQQDVDLLIAPGIVEVAGPRLTMRPAAGVPMLHVERPRVQRPALRHQDGRRPAHRAAAHRPGLAGAPRPSACWSGATPQGRRCSARSGWAREAAPSG